LPGEELDPPDASGVKTSTQPPEPEQRKPLGRTRTFSGFDDDDDFISSDEESEGQGGQQ
jgi:hypothetical protein